MIISFVTQKGGDGKTTLATNVAAEFAKQGQKVLLIDADEQASAREWASLRENDEPKVIGLARSKMAGAVLGLAKEYDITVIDVPPRSREIARSCIVASDLVLLPIKPSHYGARAASSTVAQIREAQKTRPNIKCAFVISMKKGNTMVGRYARQLVSEMGVAVLDTEIEDRTAFVLSAFAGESVAEYAPGSPADQEIKSLTEEIKRYVD